MRDALRDSAMSGDFLADDEVECLRGIAERIRERNGEVMYGYFPGGDPREFHPDEESCSADELEAHKRACQLMEEGRIDAVDGRHHWPLLKDGEIVGHVTHARFGIGTYEIKCGEVDKLANDLDEWLDRARKLEEMYR